MCSKRLHVLDERTRFSLPDAADDVKKCHDVNQHACQRMFAKQHDMCDDPCIANICKDTCRYCRML